MLHHRELEGENDNFVFNEPKAVIGWFNNPAMNQKEGVLW